jgi:hypothetical protein
MIFLLLITVFCLVSLLVLFSMECYLTATSNPRLSLRQVDAGERLTRARTFKCLWGPGIDSKESIPPAYLAWRAGTITLFLLGS